MRRRIKRGEEKEPTTEINLKANYKKRDETEKRMGVDRDEKRNRER